MKVVNTVTARCAESDVRYKGLATEYRKTSKVITQRIEELKRQINISEEDSVSLKLRINILSQMYRTASEIGREAEHYYEGGWWRSEVYTLNAR